MNDAHSLLNSLHDRMSALEARLDGKWKHIVHERTRDKLREFWDDYRVENNGRSFEVLTQSFNDRYVEIEERGTVKHVTGNVERQRDSDFLCVYLEIGAATVLNRGPLTASEAADFIDRSIANPEWARQNYLV